MKPENTYCQSCGMPMKHDPHGGGTNANGKHSMLYCSYCYGNGKFYFNGTLAEFQNHCREMMRKNGKGFIASKFGSWLLTRGMSRLERWKKQQ